MTTTTQPALSRAALGALDLIRRFSVDGRLFVHYRRAGLKELERAGLVTLERKGDVYIATLTEDKVNG